MAPQIDHTRAEQLFSAYIDQRATADEKAFVERHVAACADCRAKLDATRAMVAALRALPQMKAPRSFVLPKEMERKARPSILSWYPALRVATALAAVAFIITFAGDLITPRPGTVAMIPMQASAPAQPTQMAEPTLKQAAPAEAPAPAAPAPAAPAGDAARVSPTPTPETLTAAGAAEPVTDTATMTESMALAMEAAPEATPENPATAEVQPDGVQPDVTSPENQAAGPVEAAAPQTDWLRVAEIVLGGLVIVLGAATLIVRRWA